MPARKAEIKQCLDRIYDRAKEKRKELTEEDLRTYFIKTDILKHLGYKKIGEDIRLEKTICKKRKRPDIQCLDMYGNVIFIVEFKKPSDNTNLKEHLPQLWDRYVVPLKARYGILTNGLTILIYERIGLNHHIVLDKNLHDIDESDCQLIYNRLQKPSYDMTNIKKVLAYFKKFSDSNEMRPLNTELARELFFEDFMLKPGSLFSKLIRGTVELFDYQYGRSKFLTSAYDFWLKSYAKKPDKIPESWKKLLNNFGLSTSDVDLNKFMFCLETTYALFTRLILAKACEDYKFPHINFDQFLSKIKGFRGDIPLVSWGILLTEWIENMRDNLVESVFEEDIFYWWTDKFSEMRTWESWKLFSFQYVDSKLLPFSKCLADVMFTLYKYDFSKIAGDPLGDLYQKYFDRETRKALGEFYTPKEVVNYILDAVEYKGQFVTDKRLLDPACGSGTFLVEALNRYLDASQSEAKEKGWGEVLKKLCNEFHIVGFDIHPFATIMAQIHFMLVLIPYYKKAIEEEKTFVLRRIPIFRTDSLIDERKQKRADIMSFNEGARNVKLKMPLPIKKEIADKEFLEIEVVMPRSREVWAKTDLRNIPEYFCALQAIFDAVKYQARNEEYTIDTDIMERRLKEYLKDKNWSALVNFFTPYANQILNTIKDLKYKFGDGRLVKSVEDVMLAGLLKNYVRYDYVVGNPPYVRIQKIPKSQREGWQGYVTKSGNYDIYLLFIERGLKWAKQNGRVGYIIPNRFATVNYGEDIRRFLKENATICEYIDFRDTGVFKDALNYPVILIMHKPAMERSTIKVCRVISKPEGLSDKEILKKIRHTLSTISKISDYHYEEIYDCFLFESSELDEKPWYLMPKHESEVFKKIEDMGEPLITFSQTPKEDSALFEGLSTGAKDIYVVKKTHILSSEKTQIQQTKSGKVYEIETEILKPYLNESHKWIASREDTFIIFPYYKIESKYKLMPPAYLKEKFPLAWKYLNEHKSILEKRAGFKGKTDWYRYSAPRSLEYYYFKKLIVQGFSKLSSVAIDLDTHHIFGPDIYGMAFDENTPVEMIKLLLAIMNSLVANYYIKHISVIHGSGYYKFEDRFIKHLPIKLPKTQVEKKIAKKIVDKVDQILSQCEINKRVENFPNAYLEMKEGIELNKITYTFKTNHKFLEPSIAELVDGGYGITLGKKEDTISVETKARAEYISISLTGKNVKIGEKLKILIPTDENKVRDILKEYKADKKQLEKLPISKLEDEINELVYELYGLDVKDRKVIEEFLMKF